jgi:hypothetical protein
MSRRWHGFGAWESVAGVPSTALPDLATLKRSGQSESRSARVQRAGGDRDAISVSMPAIAGPTLPTALQIDPSRLLVRQLVQHVRFLLTQIRGLLSHSHLLSPHVPFILVHRFAGRRSQHFSTRFGMSSKVAT